MKYLLQCRRFITSNFAIVCLTFLGAYKGMDTSTTIAMVAMGLAASNAAEKTIKRKYDAAAPKE